jgi:hypothetical protein
MGYFDGLIEAGFGKTADGRTLFSPFGILGASYAVSEESARKIKLFLKNYMLLCLITLAVSITIFRLPGLFLIVVLMPVYVHKIKGLLSGEKRISQRPSLRDTTRNMARAMGLATCVLLLIANCLLFLASIFCLSYLQAIWVGILGVILSGLGIFHSSLLVKYSLERGGQS